MLSLCRTPEYCSRLCMRVHELRAKSKDTVRHRIKTTDHGGILGRCKERKLCFCWGAPSSRFRLWRYAVLTCVTRILLRCQHRMRRSEIDMGTWNDVSVQLLCSAASQQANGTPSRSGNNGVHASCPTSLHVNFSCDSQKFPVACRNQTAGQTDALG